MSVHRAEVLWSRGDQNFVDQRYSRVHQLRFDGGAVVAGSASPSVVPEPLSDPAAVDPEEAFVAALSACHMLWFLSIAAAAGLTVDTYQDRAEGTLGRDTEGRLAITEVVLRPQVRFLEPGPTPSRLEALHAQAHERCFLANSIRAPIRIETVAATSATG
jgi:organic hydroperoxide reductase OsmC/OhrA